MKNNFPISLWLTESKEYVLHCLICGNSLGIKVAGYPQKGIVGLGGTVLDNPNSPIKFPITIHCKNKNERWGHCVAKYIIQGYIYPQKDED